MFEPFDLVLVGGGLANALVALAVLDRAPATRLAVVEAGERFGGNHTWSFHEGDVPAAAQGFVAPLVEHTWPGYQVAFPGFERTVRSAYHSVSSARLHQVLADRLAQAPGAVALLGRKAVHMTGDAALLDDGTRLEGRLVVDARGPESMTVPAGAAFQKFVGIELELARPAGRGLPLLMDARVPQLDGFRFVYTLPLAADRLLVEDTYYSTDPTLDRSALTSRVLGYAVENLGATVRRLIRRESGVLPLPLTAPPMRDEPGPLRAGYAGGWFHPTTGYSFAPALRLALHVAALPPGDARGRALERLAARHRRQASFCALLNRLLFTAVEPSQRRNVLARFYRLPEPTIARFYAMTTTPGDRARIVCGRPPEGFSLGALAKRRVEA